MNYDFFIFFFAPRLDQIIYIDLRALLELNAHCLHGNSDVLHPSTLNTNSSFS